MRYGEIEPIKTLDEVRMAPSNLRQFAGSPEAKGIRAGFEAELYFGGVLDTSEEAEREPDFEYDQIPRDIEHIINFFQSGEGYLSRYYARDLRNKLYDSYQNWIDEKATSEFNRNKTNNVVDWIAEQDWWEDYAKKHIPIELDKEWNQSAIPRIMASWDHYKQAVARGIKFINTKEDFPIYKSARRKVLKNLAQQIISDDNTVFMKAAQEHFIDYFKENEASERAWLQDEFGTMRGVRDQYDLIWPYWTGSNSTFEPGEFNANVASEYARSWTEFSGEVSKAGGYHGVTRDDKTWIFEDDGSLDEPNSDDDMPCEVVSPPMPLDKCLAMLDKFWQWANDNGAYTNGTTGFHMSVSLPQHDAEKIDFVKLALFLGDIHVLEKFDRASNDYCKSAVEILERRIEKGDVDMIGAMAALRDGLLKIASHVMAPPNENDIQRFDKYTSINPKTGYVEFRSAGNEDYEKNIAALQDTLLRYARAMKIASDPAAERQEYQKKLYKMLETGDDEDNLFYKELAKFTAGELSPEELDKWYKRLKARLQQKNIRRQAATGKNYYEWEIRLKSEPYRKWPVTARTAKEAIDEVIQNEPYFASVPASSWIATPIKQVAAPRKKRAALRDYVWEIYLGGGVAGHVIAPNLAAAKTEARRWFIRGGVEVPDPIVVRATRYDPNDWR